MNPIPGVTVFIPVFNEQRLLAPNTGRLVLYLDSLGIPFEIILGSNGSTDRTVTIAACLSREDSRIRWFHLAEKGVGAAFRRGVALAGFDRIVTVDMDLSIALEFIPQAYRLLDRYDLIIGSKITGSQKRSWIRKAASNSFIHLARLLLRIDFHDYSIAAKGYRKGLVEQYLPFVDEETFYVVEIICRAHRDGRRLVEIPVACRDMRASRFNLMHEGVYKFGNLFRLWLGSFYPRKA